MRRTRLGLRLGAALVAGLLSTTPGRAAPPGAAELLAKPLTCTFRTVQAGQFHDTDFASGPLGGSAVLTVAASPDDLRLKRAAVIEEDRAGVADILSLGSQIVLFEADANNATTMLSLFTAARQGAAVPAAFSRHSLIGSIPVVIQSAGTCVVP